jgi:hypothetical protein
MLQAAVFEKMIKFLPPTGPLVGSRKQVRWLSPTSAAPPLR